LPFPFSFCFRIANTNYRCGNYINSAGWPELPEYVKWAAPCAHARTRSSVQKSILEPKIRIGSATHWKSLLAQAAQKTAGELTPAFAPNILPPRVPNRTNIRPLLEASASRRFHPVAERDHLPCQRIAHKAYANKAYIWPPACAYLLS